VLIGSTKIITIVVSYFDIFFGFPLRFVFGFINDRLKGVAPRARARARAAPAPWKARRVLPAPGRTLGLLVRCWCPCAALRCPVVRAS
jgi:hypothetical protein